MSSIMLVYNTLKHGYNNCARSTLITALMIIAFIVTTMVVVRLHFRLMHKEVLGLKKIVKIVPMIVLSGLTYLFLWYMINDGFNYKKRIWQADYFVAFVINLTVLLVITPVYLATIKVGNTSTVKTRRKWVQYLINGTFKVSFFFFWAFILTPYYVLLTSYEEFFIGGKHAVGSFFIFVAFCTICYFSFGRTPFAPLLPTVILWGACGSYYSFTYSATYCVFFNLTCPFLIVVGALFGFGFLDFLKPVLTGARSIWAAVYVWFLISILAFTWTVLWLYYGYGQGGTGYESFIWKSWY